MKQCQYINSLLKKSLFIIKNHHDKSIVFLAVLSFRLDLGIVSQAPQLQEIRFL